MKHAAPHLKTISTLMLMAGGCCTAIAVAAQSANPLIGTWIGTDKGTGCPDKFVATSSSFYTHIPPVAHGSEIAYSFEPVYVASSKTVMVQRKGAVSYDTWIFSDNDHAATGYGLSCHYTRQ